MRGKRYFQWIRGDNAGTVSLLESMSQVEGEYFYDFADGETCNAKFISGMTKSPADLDGKVMVEIPNPQCKWRIETIKTERRAVIGEGGVGDTVEVPPLEDITSKSADGTKENLSLSESAVGKTRLYPPNYPGGLRELPNMDEWLVEDDADGGVTSGGTEESAAPTVAASPAPEPRENRAAAQEERQEERISNDPVVILVDHCQKHPVTINMAVEAMLPSVGVYRMAAGEFENGAETFVDYVASKIGIEDIRKAVRLALKESYESEGREQGDK